MQVRFWKSPWGPLHSILFYDTSDFITWSLTTFESFSSIDMQYFLFIYIPCTFRFLFFLGLHACEVHTIFIYLFIFFFWGGGGGGGVSWKMIGYANYQLLCLFPT